MMDEYDIDAYMDSVYEYGDYGFGSFGRRRKEYSSDSDSCCTADCYDPYADWSEDENEDFSSICANSKFKIPSVLDLGFVLCGLYTSWIECFVVLVPPSNVAALKEIASLNVAIALWNHRNLSQLESLTLEKRKSEWTELRSAVLKSVKELQIPKLVADDINRYVYKIGDEITKWVSYHSLEILRNRKDLSLYCVIPHLVWYSNGTINCKETAKNMQSSQLNNATKYKFLFAYCLENEIERIPISCLNDVLIVEDELMSFSAYPLIYYWLHYVRNELHKIPKEESLSMDSFMFKHDRVDNWSAKKYFFNRMSCEEQIQNAVSLIDSYVNRKYQKSVLTTLNESQRLQVYMHRALKIMKNYADQSNNSKDLLSTWFEIRHLITQDEFVSLFRYSWECKVNSTVLADIWTSASVAFKNHLLNYDDHIFVKNVLRTWNWRNDGDMLCIILSNANFDIKRKITKTKFFSEYCEGLLVRRRKSLGLDKLLNLCFPDVQESVKFKQDLVINSPCVKNRCFRYYGSGKTERLNASLLLFLSPYPELIAEYKKNLVLSTAGMANCVYHMESENLHKIIADSLPDANEATEFKKRLIFSPEVVKKLHYKMLNDGWSPVDRCLDRYLTSNEDKNALRKLVFGDPVQFIRIVLYKREESWLQHLLLGYLNNVEAVQQFKSTLPVNSIFNDMLKSSIFKKYDESHRLSYCTFNNIKNITFIALNRFLNWYFETPDNVKKYKLQRIDSYQDIYSINTLLKKKDDKYLRLAMNWFFDNDVAEINKFKEKHNGKIITVI